MTAYENTVSLKRGEDSEKAEELGRRYEKRRVDGRIEEEFGPRGTKRHEH